MEVSLSYLPYLAARVTNTPLMVDNSKLETILSVIGSRIGIDTTKAPSLFGLTREPGGLVITPTGIGIVPIFGTLLKRSSNLNATSGLLSYATIEEMIQEAANNPKVEGLLLDIDSPGGEVGGVFDLAAMIRDVGTDKPIWALADDAFSAAYLIASAAHRIILPQTAGVGSVGVIAVHVDESQRDAKEGRQYTTVFSGSRKNDFSSHASLSDDAQDRLQKEVDRIYGLFVGAVAQGRNMSEAAICATEASLFFGTDAVTAGLADQVGTLRDALADLTSQIDQTKRITFHAAATPLVSKHEEKPMATEEPAVEKTATQENPTPPPEAPVNSAEVADLSKQETPSQQTNHATGTYRRGYRPGQGTFREGSADAPASRSHCGTMRSRKPVRTGR